MGRILCRKFKVAVRPKVRQIITPNKKPAEAGFVVTAKLFFNCLYAHQTTVASE